VPASASSFIEYTFTALTAGPVRPGALFIDGTIAMDGDPPEAKVPRYLQITFGHLDLVNVAIDCELVGGSRPVGIPIATFTAPSALRWVCRSQLRSTQVRVRLRIRSHHSRLTQGLVAQSLSVSQKRRILAPNWGTGATSK
jgi:hypothetical protein